MSSRLSDVNRLAEGPPTLATVAAEAGVSRQTVSNALNSPELLRPETLERVQEAITRLGYSPNRAARNLRTRASHLLGLRVEAAVENSANALMDRFVHSLVERTRDAGYHVLLFTGGGSGAAVSDPGGQAGAQAPDTQAGDRDAPGTVDPLDGYDELLRSAAVDAFVVTDTYRGNPQAAWLEERGVPFVAFGRPWGDPQARHPWVDVDGRAGIELAVDHLVERGHERIAWVGWQKGSFIGEDRRGGWTDRLRDHGLATSRLSARGDDTLDFGRRAAHALLESERPTAFVCASDTLAMGVTRALHERGLRAGQDVAVTGFDDSIAAQVCTPGLTSVRQPLEQVAAEVVRCLGDLLAHRPVERQGTTLTPTLSVRQTT
jgi:DNA-binding LacI/PurR family transcriptional regulator